MMYAHAQMNEMIWRLRHPMNETLHNSLRRRRRRIIQSTDRCYTAGFFLRGYID